MTTAEFQQFNVPLGVQLAIVRTRTRLQSASVILSASPSSVTTATEDSSSFSNKSFTPPKFSTPVRSSPRLSQKRRSLQSALEGGPSPKKSTTAPASVNFPSYLRSLSREGNYAYVRIDVKTIAKTKLTSLLPCLRNGLLKSSDRKKFCEGLLEELCTLIKSWYPHALAKLQLAKDIVSAWPKLSSAVGEPWSAYSAPGGHLEQALRSLRKDNGATMRQRRASSKSCDTSEGPSNESGEAACTSQPAQNLNASAPIEQLINVEDQIEIANLASMEDTPEHRVAILEGMAKHFEVRQGMVAASRTVNQIAQMFPKILSYQGAVIEADFSQKFGNCGATFCGSFQILYKDAILKYAERCDPKLKESLDNFCHEDSNLKALLALVHIVPKLPSVNTKRKGKSKANSQKGKCVPSQKYPANIKLSKGCVPHPALFQVVERNVDVVEYTSSFWRIKSDDEPKQVQPYLLLSSDDNTGGEFYLKANDLTMHVGNHALKAFSVLIKYHHIFDVKYDADLVHFYTFMEYLLGVPGAKDNITPKMDELLINLRNC